MGLADFCLYNLFYWTIGRGKEVRSGQSWQESPQGQECQGKLSLSLFFSWLMICIARSTHFSRMCICVIIYLTLLLIQPVSDRETWISSSKCAYFFFLSFWISLLVYNYMQKGDVSEVDVKGKAKRPDLKAISKASQCRCATCSFQDLIVMCFFFIIIMLIVLFKNPSQLLFSFVQG